MRLLTIALFLLRHAVAAPAVALVLCIVWTVVYFLLLVLAVVMNSGLGSPVLLPIGIVGIVIICLVLGWGIFAPACAIGAATCQAFRLPKFAAIPIVWVSSCLIGFGLATLYLHYVRPDSIPTHSDLFMGVALFLTLPLAGYWCVTEGPFVLFDIGKQLWIRYRKKCEQTDAANRHPFGTSDMLPANPASRAGSTPEASGDS